MTREEAMRIAQAFVNSRPDLADCVFEASDAVRVPARYRLVDTTYDAWAVHFPYRPIEEVLFRVPDALTVEIDDHTGEAKVMRTL